MAEAVGGDGDLTSHGQRTAVVLFSLGGPDAPEAVRPFLFNLFNDPAIMRLPGPLRWCLAQLVSRRRAPVAKEIYAHLGGRSPLLERTQAQAGALESALGEGVRVFIAMRYWHPLVEEAAREVKDFEPERIVLLPLYPQLSTTTTTSSLTAWKRGAARAVLVAPTAMVCCYPTEPGFVAAHARLIDEALGGEGLGNARVLFSAHGLPKRIVAQGDPYVWQVERTAAAVTAALEARGRTIDGLVCYQSRVGPLEWVGPSTREALSQAGAEKKPVVVVPIAFVSEHSETLVELDITYREVAESAGVPAYVRVPALGTDSTFIAALAGLVRWALGQGTGTTAADDACRCPGNFAGCGLGDKLR